MSYEDIVESGDSFYFEAVASVASRHVTYSIRMSHCPYTGYLDIAASRIADGGNSVHAGYVGAGTFAGQVVANSTSQTPATMLLRNSKLVTTETNPSNNGEIVWQYG